MKTIYKADSRGFAEHGWLKSHHTFSFADYYNPNRMNFGALRVLNDDWIAPNRGFGMHPHRDMEIITIPLKGTLHHKDNMGNSKTITKGEVQVMSAGTGVVHSEFNDSNDTPVELLQIWIIPNALGVEPRYEQKEFTNELKDNTFSLVVSPDGRSHSLSIHQNAFFSLGKFSQDCEMKLPQYSQENGLYLFLVEGSATIAGESLQKRDAIGLYEKNKLSIEVAAKSEILLMEVPMNN